MSKTSDLFDLMALGMDQDKPQACTIIHPVTGEPLDITFWLTGPHSETARRARHQAVERWVRLPGYTRRSAESFEMKDKLSRLILAGRVVRWDVKENGEPIPFNFDAVLRVLEASPTIFDQVEAFADNAGNWWEEKQPTEASDGTA